MNCTAFLAGAQGKKWIRSVVASRLAALGGTAEAAVPTWAFFGREQLGTCISSWSRHNQKSFPPGGSMLLRGRVLHSAVVSLARTFPPGPHLHLLRNVATESSC